MARAEIGSLRLSRSDTERLVTALLISLCLHLAAISIYEVGKKEGWWQEWHLPAWLHKKKNPTLALVQPPEAQPQIYIDVTDPDATPPPKTIYYSDQNAHAANPDKDKNLHQPKLDGKHNVPPKTEDAQRLSRQQSSPPPTDQLHPSPEKPPSEQANESNPMNLGDVKPTKQPENKNNPQTPQPNPRPRTLKEARLQNHVPGPKSSQDGDAHHHLTPNFDAAKSPFGDYDRALIDAVTEHWYDILDRQNFAEDRTGIVVIKFRLEYDGTVRNLQVLQNDVGPFLGDACQAAIDDSAPFGPWPDNLRAVIGANYRDITFTFNYY